MGLREAFFPSGELEITENGTYNVKEKESVNVNVSGGGGGGQPTDGKYLVQFLGINEVIQTGRYNTGDVVTLPSAPTYEGMVFQSWSSPVTVTNNTVTVGNSDLTLGAVYETASGATEIDITLTPGTGLDFEINLFNNVTSIDWGDGSTSSALGAHTYSDYGDYTVKVYASGNMSDGSEDTNMFGSTSESTPNYKTTAVRLGNAITSIENYALQYCYSLTSITIPDSVSTLGGFLFSYCYSLKSVTIPNSVTSTDGVIFGMCLGLTSITIPNSVTSADAFTLNSCYSLKSVTIPNSVTRIEMGAFGSCPGLTSITIPNSVTSIWDGAFGFCHTIIEYDFSSYTSTDTVPTLSSTDAFMGINAICKMYFRDQATLDNFSNATNWSAFANYMYIKE